MRGDAPADEEQLDEEFYDRALGRDPREPLPPPPTVVRERRREPPPEPQERPYP